MLVYDKFIQSMDWTPRVIDELDLEEEFWLPVVKEAKSDAVAMLQAVNEAQRPLQYEQ